MEWETIVKVKIIDFIHDEKAEEKTKNNNIRGKGGWK